MERTPSRLVIEHREWEKNGAGWWWHWPAGEFAEEGGPYSTAAIALEEASKNTRSNRERLGHIVADQIDDLDALASMAADALEACYDGRLNNGSDGAAESFENDWGCYVEIVVDGEAQ